MNDYEKMRKMNELAKDLKQHGFADSSFEAIKQAGQIYGDEEMTHEVKHGLIQSKQDRMVGEEKMSETDFDRKFKKLQENIDTLTTKMNEMIQALNDMDSRITQLSKKQREERFAPHEEMPVQNKETPVEKKQEEPAHHEEKHQTESGEYANQRVGNYQSQDVSIDKMFYFGKK
jgi:ABC-type phosphate transport system auxiliary subunit